MTQSQPTAFLRTVHDGVALLGDRDAAGRGVTFCFTERLGGVSKKPYDSLNLGAKGGDDLRDVLENRRRVMAALGACDLLEGLVIPNQVHGDEVVVIDGAAADVFPALERGCDAVVCTTCDQAVMLLFADCTPVVLTAPGGFAVVHSGWRGTLAGIAGKAASRLVGATGCDASEVRAFIGPHICAASYEVSDELASTFAGEFGASAVPYPRHLDMSACIAASLAANGVGREAVLDCGLCTALNTDRFYSHRAEHGLTGRHAAVAFMRGAAKGGASDGICD